MVCMGYGITRPTLGNSLYKVIGLGFIYFSFAYLQDLFKDFSNNGNMTEMIDLPVIVYIYIIVF